MLLKAGKEQFFGKLNIAVYIRHHFANVLMFLMVSGLAGLSMFMSVKSYEINNASVIYKARLEEIERDLASFIPPGTKEEDIPKAIHQLIFKHQIEATRCLDELEMAKQMLLEPDKSP